jgi:hypothetical protein
VFSDAMVLHLLRCCKNTDEALASANEDAFIPRQAARGSHASRQELRGSRAFENVTVKIYLKHVTRLCASIQERVIRRDSKRVNVSDKLASLNGMRFEFVDAGNVLPYVYAACTVFATVMPAECSHVQGCSDQNHFPQARPSSGRTVLRAR